MANERTGAYAEVESLKKGKHRIGRDYRRLEMLFAALGAFVSLIAFTENFFSNEAFYYSIMDYISGKGATKKFDYERYLIIVGVVLYYFYNFFNGSITRWFLNLILHPLHNKYINILVGFLVSVVGFFISIPGVIIPPVKKFKQYFVSSAKQYLRKCKENSFPVPEKTITGKILSFTCGWLFKVKENITIKEVIFTLLYDAPIRAINSVFTVPNDLKENLSLEGNYMSKLKNNFFFQVVQTEDGLSRAKRLTIFKDREYLFGKDTSNRIKALFREPAMFDDLFLIIEGYLNKGLYDTVLYRPSDDIYPDEYCKKHGLPNERNYKYFQTYLLRKNENGEFKDSVVLSLNAIRIYMFDKKKKYAEFLDEIFSVKTGISSMTGDFAYRVLTLTRDVHFRKKIADFITSEYKSQEFQGMDQNKANKLRGIAAEKIAEVEQIFEKGVEQYKIFSQVKNKSKNLKANMLPRGIKAKFIRKQLSSDSEEFNIFDTVLIDYIKDIMITDFSLVLFKMVIGQFMNLPAGIMVVKIEDYSTRMILEYYKQFCEIEIVAKRNDGQSKEFQSDNYVNLFLQSYAAFCNQEEKTKLFSELYFKFNTMEYIKPYNQEELIKLIDAQGYDKTVDLDKNKQEDSKNTLVRSAVEQDVLKRQEDKLKALNGENSDENSD